MYSYLYPGQGSQFPGMGQFLCENFKVAQETFEEASDVLSLNIKKLCFEGPESELALTQNTQPALLTTSVATGRVLEQIASPRVIGAAGHSIGEYAACVMAGALPFGKAVMAVRVRGESMQRAVPVGEGGMAALLGLDSEQVKFICQWTTTQSKLGLIEPANYNAPGQIVVSGHSKAIQWLKDHTQDNDLLESIPKSESGESVKKIKMIPLNVSAPFHCSLMKPAEEIMKHVLNEIQFSESCYPVVQNFDSEAHRDANSIRNNLVAQVSGAVRWTDCVHQLIKMGATEFLEVGAGKVISGLVKKINPQVVVYNFNSLDDIKLFESKFGAQK